jgi:ribosomal protein S18 acetylase RimI-like enzyme
MGLKFRKYLDPQDYRRVSDFLIQHYQPGNRDGNWLEPVWEYAHGHPNLDRSSLDKIGIWEDSGEIVAVANYESRLPEAFFQFHPSYRYLMEEMLDYAEQNLYGRDRQNGRKTVWAYVNDYDEQFLSLLRKRGYKKEAYGTRPLAQFLIPDPFPPITLPQGFRLVSLADDCDWAKVHRVLWRGFDHPGEPHVGELEIEERRKMFDTPKARRDLKIATQAPNGEFASFCGMFYEGDHRYAYVEPVATDPAYRRLGLGKAAVLEGIRRCAKLGATVAYVGSDQPFYLSMGFEVLYNQERWVKYLDD